MVWSIQNHLNIFIAINYIYTSADKINHDIAIEYIDRYAYVHMKKDNKTVRSNNTEIHICSYCVCCDATAKKSYSWCNLMPTQQLMSYQTVSGYLRQSRGIRCGSEAWAKYSMQSPWLFWCGTQHYRLMQLHQGWRCISDCSMALVIQTDVVLCLSYIIRDLVLYKIKYRESNCRISAYLSTLQHWHYCMPHETNDVITFLVKLSLSKRGHG